MFDTQGFFRVSCVIVTNFLKVSQSNMRHCSRTSLLLWISCDNLGAEAVLGGVERSVVHNIQGVSPSEPRPGNARERRHRTSRVQKPSNSRAYLSWSHIPKVHLVSFSRRLTRSHKSASLPRSELHSSRRTGITYVQGCRARQSRHNSPPTNT